MTKILIADDSRVIQEVLRLNFERAGFHVVIAGNGREAVELLKTDRFDLVITDEQMPEMSGLEFCRHLRQDPHHAETPVLFCSAKAFELDPALAGELGIVRMVSKPFSPREVVETVRAALERPAEQATRS